jgi:hypothetical protein
VPVHGGSVSELRPLLNLGSDDDWRLAVAWMLCAFRGQSPYPILGIAGEQETAKSTMARMLRALVDPNQCALRSPPRDAHDLAIGARNGHVLGFDNLTTIQPWFSDALCRLSTGGGFSTRRLYTDDTEELFTDTRPCLFTSIITAATAGDLLDRCFLLDLPRIADEDRQQEQAILASFEQVRPYALGGLCDALSFALARQGSVSIENAPRLVDACYWAEQAGPALGWEPYAYRRNRMERVEHALDASLIAAPLRTFIDKQPGQRWQGQAGVLLAALNAQVGEEMQRRRDWPDTASKMGSALKRLAPDLRASGINVEKVKRTEHAREWHIEKVGKGPSAPSSPSGEGPEPAAGRQNESVTGDDGVDDGPSPYQLPLVTPENWQQEANSGLPDDRDDGGDGHSPPLSMGQGQIPACPNCGGWWQVTPLTGGRVHFCDVCKKSFSVGAPR